MSCCRSPGALNSDAGDIITGDQERVNLLNTYFFSTYTADNGTNTSFDRVAGFADDSNIETILVKAAIKMLNSAEESVDLTN